MTIPPNAPLMASLSDHARIAELVEAYLSADYRWELDGDWHDLHVGLPAPAVEFCFAQAQTFGVVSAWDPHSITRPEQVNRAADQSLHNALMASGKAFRAAFSCATNRSWREPSWLVADLPAAAFDALSRRFGQLATLWWEAGQPVRLRVDARRPPDFGDDTLIDWLVLD